MLSPKELKTDVQAKACTRMFEQHYSQYSGGGNNPNPPTHEWITKMLSIHTMEHHSTTRRSEIPTCATTRINLENSALSERKSDTKGHVLYEMSRANPQRQEAGWWLSGTWGTGVEEMGNNYLIGGRFPFGVFRVFFFFFFFELVQKWVW